MDVVVTLPKSFRFAGQVGLGAWITEGDPAGAPWSGELWEFATGGARPRIEPGERVYVVHHGKLRGYAPLVELEYDPRHRLVSLVRGGGAVAVTVPFEIRGFRGWRYRWWERDIEVPFPEWQTV